MDSLKQLGEILLALFHLLGLFWPLWVIMGFMLFVRLSLKLYKAYRLSKSGIAELDKLDGQDFEKYLELLFRKLGYKVKRTPYLGDYGADLVIQKAGIQTVVQAKRYHRSVGVKAVQEVVAAKEYYKSNKAMVVTNSYYSQQAKKLAKVNQVELWDRNDLVNKLLSLKKQAPVGVEPSVNSELDRESFVSEPILPASSAAHCEICEKSVSPQINRYCLSHPEIFGGKIYCYEHQKFRRHKAGRKAIKPD